jgi:hypothetical protein
VLFFEFFNCYVFVLQNFRSICENLEDKNITIEEFKAKHRKEGEFTDEDGIIVLTTAI